MVMVPEKSRKKEIYIRNEQGNSEEVLQEVSKENMDVKKKVAKCKKQMKINESLTRRWEPNESVAVANLLLEEMLYFVDTMDKLRKPDARKFAIGLVTSKENKEEDKTKEGSISETNVKEINDKNEAPRKSYQLFRKLSVNKSLKSIPIKASPNTSFKTQNTKLRKGEGKKKENEILGGKKKIQALISFFTSKEAENST